MTLASVPWWGRLLVLLALVGLRWSVLEQLRKRARWWHEDPSSKRRIADFVRGISYFSQIDIAILFTILWSLGGLA